ncbi:MAG: hypothetical protein ACRD03_02920 [Acidimicrobiales bacterium]
MGSIDRAAADPEEQVDVEQLAAAADATLRELVELDAVRAARLAGAWLGAASARAREEQRDLEYPDPRPQHRPKPRPQTHT